MTTLPQLLCRSAVDHGARTAVEDPGRRQCITYRELDAQSDFLRHALVRAGVRPGDRVGLFAPKSIAGVAAIFGILKARAAYVPADAAAPPIRAADNFADCSIKAAFVARSLVVSLQRAWREPLVAIDDGDDLVLLCAPGPRERLDTDAGVPAIDDVAYLLYTSGSTGNPKGVIHTHRSALSFIDWCSAQFQPTEHDRFSSHAPFHFDLSIFDLFVSIKHGATLVLIGEDAGKQPAPLAALVAESRISVWYSTPSILRLLTEYGRMDHLDCGALRLVLFAGEVFPVKHLRALKRVWPHPRYFNLYGPTETNVCTYFEIPSDIPEGRTDPFPIGWPCSDDRTMVVDQQQRQVPRGADGELYVSGGSVMAGYWNLPDKTARAFFLDDAGARWYRTGDVVVETDAEGYRFVGRRDRMVKRRGYRVELGEIEAALYRHPDVIEAAVIAASDEDAGVVIQAFLAWSSASRPSLIEMKRFCSEQLPLYMIPDRIAFRDALPKTSTDKVDYQRLAERA